jgi:hypothetical protein
MPTDEVRTEFSALIDRVERDAFQRGWDAALKHVMAAAANAPQAQAVTLPAGTSGTPQRAGYGIVPALVREMLDEATDRGIVPADVVARGRERGDDIAESSVRQRLRKMKIAGEARNERGRWFRVRPTTGPAEQETGDADTSPENTLALDDGGFHAAA